MIHPTLDGIGRVARPGEVDEAHPLAQGGEDQEAECHPRKLMMVAIKGL